MLLYRGCCAIFNLGSTIVSVAASEKWDAFDADFEFTHSTDDHSNAFSRAVVEALVL